MVDIFDLLSTIAITVTVIGCALCIKKLNLLEREIRKHKENSKTKN